MRKSTIDFYKSIKYDICDIFILSIFIPINKHLAFKDKWDLFSECYRTFILTIPRLFIAQICTMQYIFSGLTEAFEILWSNAEVKQKQWNLANDASTNN